MSRKKKDLKVELSPMKLFKPRLPSPDQKKMGTKRIEERKGHIDEDYYDDQIEDYLEEESAMKAVSGIVLMIDDLKDIECDIAARTYDEGITALQEYEIDFLWLDHDLADEDERKTGYGIVSWLEEKWIVDGESFWPLEIGVTTGNPSGRKMIELVLQKYYTRTTTLHHGYTWKLLKLEEPSD